jgi:hypothetical protein
MSFILETLEKLIDIHIRGGVLAEKNTSPELAYRAGTTTETAISTLLKD